MSSRRTPSRTRRHDRSRGNRQRKTEAAPRARPVFRPDPSAVSLDDALGNKQSEADTAAIVLCQLNKAVKHRLQLVVWNAFACVAHTTDDVAVHKAEAHDHAPLCRRELEGVAQQIAEHL